MHYEIKDLTRQDLQVILQGLGELSLNVGLNLFSNLQMQIAVQNEKSATPLPDARLQQITGADQATAAAQASVRS